MENMPRLLWEGGREMTAEQLQTLGARGLAAIKQYVTVYHPQTAPVGGFIVGMLTLILGGFIAAQVIDARAKKKGREYEDYSIHRDRGTGRADYVGPTNSRQTGPERGPIRPNVPTLPLLSGQKRMAYIIRGHRGASSNSQKTNELATPHRGYIFQPQSGTK